MMGITLTINGKRITDIYVRNLGPIGEYDEGDGPGGDGIRRYEWKHIDGRRGMVQHARSDGPEALAIKVLGAIRQVTPGLDSVVNDASSRLGVTSPGNAT